MDSGIPDKSADERAAEKKEQDEKTPVQKAIQSVQKFGPFAFMALALPVMFYFVYQRIDPRQRASGTGQAQIVLSPNTITKSPNQEFEVDLAVTTTEKLNGIDLSMTFNKDVLELVSFTPSATFSDKIFPGNPDNALGTLKYTVVEPNTSSDITGTVSLGKLKFKGKTAGSGTVGFGTIEVTAYGNSNILTISSVPTGTYTIASSASPTIPNTTIATTPGLTITPTLSPKTSPCPPLGDVDTDGMVSMTDYNLTMQHLAGLINLPSEKIAKADVNKDGTVNSTDGLLIHRYLQGSIATFSGCSVSSLTPTITQVSIVMNPSPNSTLTGSSQLFSWSSSLPSPTKYWIHIGSTPGGSNIVNAEVGTNTSYSISNLPVDGVMLYFRLLWQEEGKSQQYKDFIYYSASLE